MKTLPPITTGSSPSRAWRRAALLGLAALALAVASTAKAAAPWSTVANPEIMQPGIAAVTCATRTNIPGNPAYVFGLYDLRNPNPADYGVCGLTAPLWIPPVYEDPSWNVTNLGNIFGIALDRDGDIYVAAHGLYAKNWTTGFGVPSGYFHRYGALGGWLGTAAQQLQAAGTVYKIDRLTGAATVFNVLPVDRLPQQVMNLNGGFMAGPGIGNIAYDPVNDQFFASNLEDGKIYRLNNAGVIQQVFDPLLPDTGAAGLPPLTEIVWGLAVSGGKLYYAVWSDSTLPLQTQIRSVNVNFAGDALVLTVPLQSSAGPSFRSPVSDITFSADGTRMFLAERTMRMFLGPAPESYNHHSRVHIAKLVGLVWTVTHTLHPGCNVGLAEAYGGVALGPELGVNEQVVHMTSADMATGPGPHGIFGVRPSDFPIYPPGSGPVSRAYKVPFDPSYNAAIGPDVKGSGGDVAIMPAASCVKIANQVVECINTNKTYEWRFCVTNCWNRGIKFLSFLDLPPGLDINEDIVMLPSVLLPGQGLCLTNYFTNTAGLTNLCFTVGAHTTNFFECCSVSNCLALAPCCVYLTSEKLMPIFMVPPMGNCYNYTFTVKNVTSPPIPIKYLFLVQDPAPPPNCIDFTPGIITFNPPLQPNQSMTKSVKVCLKPGCKGPFYFLAAAHDSNLVECCSTRHCLPKSMFCHPIDFAVGFDDALFRAGSNITVPIVLDSSIVRPSRVAVYEGTNAISSLIVAPTSAPPTLTLTWSNVLAGTYTLIAQETDTFGGVWDSPPATVYVLEAAPLQTPPGAPLLLAAGLAGGNVNLILDTAPGVACHVEYTESLAAPDWKVLRSIVGDGTRMTVTDALTNAPQRFYRVRVE